MLIKQWPNQGLRENVIEHCARCESVNDPEIIQTIEKLQSMFKIKHITSTYCQKCVQILEQELDEYMRDPISIIPSS